MTAAKLKADIESGLCWQECVCGRKMHSDYIETSDGEELPPRIVISRKIPDMVFCSRRCAIREENRIRNVEKRRRKTIARALDVWGHGITVLYASGDSRSGLCKCDREAIRTEYPGYVSFTFPGSLGDASGCPWCVQLGVQHRDVEAWNLYRLSRER